MKMKQKIGYGAALLLAFIVIGCVKSAPITEESSQQLAEEFVRNSPTYSFDGMNLEHEETLYADKCDQCYTFVFTFESRHAGYGDRTGQMLAQVITPHEAHVSVENGEVVSALLDEEWDMINQELVQ